MVRVPNANGACCTTGVPSEATYPLNTLSRASRERPFMNNLKELNPVPTSVQGSSEDSPGFIYPSYRAAGTETHGDKPPIDGSHQEVAYLSSSVGPSESSRCERSARPIRDERPEHGIRDASLEAAHRLSAPLALRQLLPMVRPAAGIAGGLAERDLMCMTLLRCRFPASQSRCLSTSPLEASIGARPA